METLHRRLTHNWVNFMYAVFHEQEGYNMEFDHLCDGALDAELIEFGFDEDDHPWKDGPGFIGIRRALESQQRTIHSN